MKTTKVGNYLSAVLLAALGIVMIALPEMVMNFICYAIAAVLIILGIVQLVSYASKDIKDAVYSHNLAIGIMFIICGVMFIIKASLIQNLVPMIMGLIIVANGIIKLQHAINLLRFKSSSSTFVLIISLLCIGIGAVLLFIPAEVNKFITIIIGIGFLVSGLSDIATYIVMSRKLKQTKTMNSTDDVFETVENPQVVYAASSSEETTVNTISECSSNESEV